MMQFGDAPLDAPLDALITGSGLTSLLFDPVPPETRERLLRFPLGEQESVLLPLQQITEILSVNLSEILPVPEMPRSVIGICSWRTEMLWLVDLNHWVGYPSPLQQEPLPTSLSVIVIQSSGSQNGVHQGSVIQNNSQFVGLAVSQVNDVELHDLQQLQPPPIGLFSPALLPMVRGMVPGCSDAVLDLQSFIHCPLWKKYPKGET